MRSRVCLEKSEDEEVQVQRAGVEEGNAMERRSCSLSRCVGTNYAGILPRAEHLVGDMHTLCKLLLLDWAGFPCFF